MDAPSFKASGRILEASWSILEASWGILEASWRCLGGILDILRHLGGRRLRGILGHLEAILGHLGDILEHLGASWAILEVFCRRLGPSWRHLGGILGLSLSQVGASGDQVPTF